MQPLLYTIVNEEKLKAMVETFYGCLNVPTQVIDENGNFLVAFGSMSNFCRCAQEFLPADDTCTKMHVNASKDAVRFGGSYIFSCHVNLNHIVFPLINKNHFLGSILVGPFLMDAPDSILITDITQKYQTSTEIALELYDEMESIRILSPERVNHISQMLYYLFYNLIDDSREELKINNQKLLQQSRINESIQRYKESNEPDTAYPYEREKELIAKVKSGNKQEANALLNELLGNVFFSSDNSLDFIKLRAIELCSLLSRAAIEGGSPTDSILKLNNHFLKNLQQVSSIDTLCFKLQEIVETFTESMFHYVPSQNSDIIKKAMVYIMNHFQQNITLDEVANYVHLHPSYFSTIFKQSTGSSFKEYLNLVRIEESKRLLTNTDYSIIDIALASGFEDQSYFSKVFKKYTGMTPKQFR